MHVTLEGTRVGGSLGWRSEAARPPMAEDPRGGGLAPQVLPAWCSVTRASGCRLSTVSPVTRVDAAQKVHGRLCGPGTAPVAGTVPLSRGSTAWQRGPHTAPVISAHMDSSGKVGPLSSVPRSVGPAAHGAVRLSLLHGVLYVWSKSSSENELIQVNCHGQSFTLEDE